MLVRYTSTIPLVNDFSLTSYAGLYCEQQTERNFIQSAIYIGSILGLFVMNPLADIKGRRFVFIAAQTVANVGVASNRCLR